MRVYLTGFMGSGKTTIGRLLARAMAWRFVDLDSEVESLAGRSVREIFAEQGEAAFRALEREALARTLDLEDLVVATGGGTLSQGANWDLVQSSGLSVWLNPAFSTLVGRIGGRGKSDRPLFRDEKQAMALYLERLAAYQRCDLKVDVGPQENAEEVAARVALLLARRVCAI